MTPQPKRSESPRYLAVRGGNYRKGQKDAVAGETYSDIPAALVDDLVARRAIRLVEGSAPETGANSTQGEVTTDA